MGLRPDYGRPWVNEAAGVGEVLRQTRRLSHVTHSMA